MTETARMNFRDRWVTDEEGKEFIFTVEMQRRLSQAGLPVEPAYLNQLREIQPPPPPPRQERRSRPPRAQRTEQRERPSYGGKTVVQEPASIQIDPQTGKYVGRVKWYNVRKGYGFILRGAGEEIFFHRSSSIGDPDELQEGEWILYDVEETAKGPEATDVEPYAGEPPA